MCKHKTHFRNENDLIWNQNCLVHTYWALESISSVLYPHSPTTSNTDSLQSTQYATIPALELGCGQLRPAHSQTFWPASVCSPHAPPMLCFPPCLNPASEEQPQHLSRAVGVPCAWKLSLRRKSRQDWKLQQYIYTSGSHPPLQSKFQAAVNASTESCNDSVQRKICQLFRVANHTPYIPNR